MSNLTERWTGLHKALADFLKNGFDKEDDDYKRVKSWLDAAQAAAVTLDDKLKNLRGSMNKVTTEPASHKVLYKLAQGAVDTNGSSATMGARHHRLINANDKADGALAKEYSANLDQAVTASAVFVAALAPSKSIVSNVRKSIIKLAGSAAASGKLVPDEILSLLESIGRYLTSTSSMAAVKNRFTDPSSFWPSSYISSTSTGGGGLKLLSDKKPGGKQKAAAKKAVPKKKGRKA